MCTATVSGRGTFLVDGSARGEDFYVATREGISLAKRGDLEVATREDFLMATDSDLSDPTGFHRAVLDFLEWLRTHNYSPVTVVDRSWYLATFISWAELRVIHRPADVTLPVLEAYQRHVSHRRKKDGMPLSWSSSPSAWLRCECSSPGARAPGASSTTRLLSS